MTKRAISATKLILTDMMLRAALLTAGAWAVACGGSCLGRPAWAQAGEVYTRPRYWYLITSRSTMEGATQERTYVLWDDPPPANGALVKAESDGTTRGYTVQTLSGPVFSKAEACAQTQIPAQALQGIGCPSAVQPQPLPAQPPVQAQRSVPRTPKKTGAELIFEFFKSFLKLTGAIILFTWVLSLLGKLFHAQGIAPGKKPDAGPAAPGPATAGPAIIMVDTKPPDAGPLAEPTSNVNPDLVHWSPQAESELEILIEENLKATKDTAVEFLDETDFRKTGTGIAEILNILDELEAKAKQGKLSNQEAQAQILQAFKHLGLDVVRAASLVSLLAALASLGVKGIQLLRGKLIGEARVAIEAGRQFERKAIKQLVAEGGTDLNQVVRDFPIVDAVAADGSLVSIAESGETASHLMGKYKILFEKTGTQSTYDKAFKLLRDNNITKTKLTELAFQRQAKLLVPRNMVPKLRALVERRVRDLYLYGECDSALARNVVKRWTNRGFSEEQILEQLVEEFTQRIISLP